MTDLSTKSVCCMDSGLFVHIAQCLATKFGRVYYHAPSQHVFPKLGDRIIGDGFENVTRVVEPFSLIGKVDARCFTDIGQCDLQRYLALIGENVWGHHGADILETHKGKFLEALEEADLEVPSHIKVKGITELRSHLKDEEDVYVKISQFRGDLETLHFRNWELDSAALDVLACRLGPCQDLVTFYVFDAINTPIEDGIDTWRVDGQWPKRVLHGMERKDKSFIGAMQNFSDIAEPVRMVNEKFGPVLDEYGYRGPFSTEARLKGASTFFTDATTRFGSPPSQLQTALITNLPEVIYHGARGEMVEPESDDAIGAQVLITSDREEKEWLTFAMPDELRPFVKSAFACEVNNALTITPNPLENWAGWLVATGSSIDDVVDTLKSLKELLPSGFDCDLTSLCDLLRELELAKGTGVKITKLPVPDPSIVLEEK